MKVWGYFFPAWNGDFVRFVKIPGTKSVNQSRIFPALLTGSCDYSLSKPNLCSSSQFRSKPSLSSDAETLSAADPVLVPTRHRGSAAFTCTVYRWLREGLFFFTADLCVIIISCEVQSWPGPGWCCRYRGRNPACKKVTSLFHTAEKIHAGQFQKQTYIE